jgi:hypothetical protein
LGIRYNCYLPDVKQMRRENGPGTAGPLLTPPCREFHRLSY